jgi:hypothetical protein
VHEEVYGRLILEAYVAGRRSELLDTTISGGGSWSRVSKLVIIRRPVSRSRYRPAFLQPRIVHMREEE